MEKYSVLMAVYYKEKAEYLRSAVESMLQQTVPPDEFVLVCDGVLTQPLNALIAQFCAQSPHLFHIVRLEKNLGLGAALNAGLLQCRNELVARMDSDDIAVRDRMEKQLAEMEKDPEVSVLGGQIAEFYDSPERILAYRTVPTEESQIREFLKHRSPMNHTTVVLRKSHVLRVGNYSDTSGFEDYILWIKLVAGGYRMRNIRDVCCRVRADAGMYARRGGAKYFQDTVKMERFLLEKEIISRRQFWLNIAVRFIGTMLLPSGVRRIVFLRFLRRRNLETAAHSPRKFRRLQVSPFKNGDLLFQREIPGQTYIE